MFLNSGESGNFGEYYYSIDQYGVCRLSDQYGWSGDAGKSHDFGDSGDYCSKCDIRKNFNTYKCPAILVHGDFLTAPLKVLSAKKLI